MTILAQAQIFYIIFIFCKYYFLSFEGRADALGKLGLAFSLGIMAGPLIGGVVAEQFGDAMVAFAASVISLLTVIMVQLFLPKSTKSKDKEETASGIVIKIHSPPSPSQRCFSVNPFPRGSPYSGLYMGLLHPKRVPFSGYRHLPPCTRIYWSSASSPTQNN